MRFRYAAGGCGERRVDLQTELSRKRHVARTVAPPVVDRSVPATGIFHSLRDCAPPASSQADSAGNVHASCRVAVSARDECRRFELPANSLPSSRVVSAGGAINYESRSAGDDRLRSSGVRTKAILTEATPADDYKRSVGEHQFVSCTVQKQMKSLIGHRYLAITTAKLKRIK